MLVCSLVADYANCCSKLSVANSENDDSDDDPKSKSITILLHV